MRVCKKMFLNTFQVGEWQVRSWKLKQGAISPPSVRLQRGTGSRNILRRKERAITFLKDLSKLPSHFCRAESTKLYLEPIFECKAEVYRTYVKELPEGEVPVSRALFDNLFDEENLSIFRPKKDLCDVCERFNKQLITKTEYDEHIANKERARKEKGNDKTGPHRVFTLDKQAILMSPKSNASAMFYKSKLSVHNYTIFDLKSREGFCFLWHEGNGGVTGNVFATLLYHFLEKCVNPAPGETIIIFSDNCTSQNKNRVLSNALLNFAVLKKCTIIQKFLTVGHTQMEADNIHATISAKVKHAEINVPSDYVKIIREAKKTPPIYVTEYLSFEFFKNFEVLRYVKSIKPDGSATVNQLKALKYTPSKQIYYKLSFDDPYKTFRSSIPDIVPIDFETLPQLYSKPVPIAKSTYDHLQDLKSVICKDYHPFYDNLTFYTSKK